LRYVPFRPALEPFARTLVYDATIVGDLTLPTELIAPFAMRTLQINRQNSSPMLRNAARALAETLFHARRRSSKGRRTTSILEVTTALLLLAEFLSN
jgi:hypothetical protein